jgi:hypothetical protein
MILARWAGIPRRIGAAAAIGSAVDAGLVELVNVVVRKTPPVLLADLVDSLGLHLLEVKAAREARAV